MAAIVVDYAIGTPHIFLFAQLALHSTADGLFTGRIASYGTLQAHVLWGRHHPNGIHIGIHSCLEEYGALDRHHRSARTLRPLLEIGTHHGMHNAIDQSDTLGIAKHIRSQIRPIEQTFGIVDLSTYGADECFANSSAFTHQSLGLAVAIIDGHAHQAQ